MRASWSLIFVLLTYFMFASLSASAITFETLPEGIYSPQLRLGTVNGLDQAYDEDGKLWRLGDLHSINFDAATLARVNPDAVALIRALNVFGSQNLGRDINYGTLLVETKPEINYQAAILAYGLKESWTLALAVPVVQYRNQVHLSSEPGNIGFYLSQLQNQSPAIDRALNLNLVTEAQKSIASKGYQQLNDRNEKFVGDAQLVSINRLQIAQSPAILKTSLILPTGPHDNPDDLLATNSFHHFEVESLFAISYPLTSRLSLRPFSSLNIPLPEREIKRVPLDENDTLPDQNQKEEVQRLRGPALGVGAEIEYLIDQRWSLETSFLEKAKQRDLYKGDRGSHYDLLSEKTDTQSGEARLALWYSTVQAYNQKQSALPGMVSFAWSDTITGKNVNRQQLNELTVMMFF